MKEISKLHFLTQDIDGITHAELVETVCKEGVDWVQLRVKRRNYQEWKDIALDVQKICRNYGAKLIINDNAELAAEIKADGVHLGKDDLDPKEARNILGHQAIIGGTANSYDDIKDLVSKKVDYIGLGPFRFTLTKEKISPILGFEGYVQIVKRMSIEGIDIPVIAIGGIKLDDVTDLLGTGAHGIAVASAINCSEDRSAAARQFMNKTMRILETK